MGLVVRPSSCFSNTSCCWVQSFLSVCELTWISQSYYISIRWTMIKKCQVVNAETVIFQNNLVVFAMCCRIKQGHWLKIKWFLKNCYLARIWPLKQNKNSRWKEYCRNRLTASSRKSKRKKYIERYWLWVSAIMLRQLWIMMWEDYKVVLQISSHLSHLQSLWDLLCKNVMKILSQFRVLLANSLKYLTFFHLVLNPKVWVLLFLIIIK